jgi:periplasmic protein CpxP/Spy
MAMRGYQKALIAGSLAVLLILGAVAVGNAQNVRRLQQGGQAAALRGMFRGGLLLRGLELTDQQKEQVKTILSNHKADIRNAAQETIKARRDLRAAMADGADQATLKAAYDKVSGAGWDALLMRNQIGSEIKQILTPEQQARLQKRMQNLKKFGARTFANRTNRKVS